MSMNDIKQIYKMLELFGIVLVVSYIVILHLIINKKVKQVDNYQATIQSFASRIEYMRERLSSDDRLKEAFESDDEIGWYFSELNSLTEDLYLDIFDESDIVTKSDD